MFGPSALDTAHHRYNAARDRVAGYDGLLLTARAALARANRTRPENRQIAQALALREINRLRSARARARDERDAAEVVLLALGGVPELVRTWAPEMLPVGCVSIADDPDMAAFREVRS